MDVTAATAEVQARGFDYLSAARILIALNNAKNAFESYQNFPWPWLETGAGPSTAPVTVSDARAILAVVDNTNNQVLPGLDIRDAYDIQPNLVQTGTPAAWYFDAVNNKVATIPASTVTMGVRYIRFSPELSAGSDTPLIPVRHHALWVDLAVLECAKDDENWGSAQSLVADTSRRLNDLVLVYAGLNRANPNLQVVTGASEDW